MRKNLKIISLITVGNILDYYDFMLFAHLGAAMTGFFIPNLNPTQTHLVSLLLFAIPFIIRPIGGYLFGTLSDRFGRGFALGQTLKYASFAGFGIAVLPGYEIAGVISMIVFVLLRALQGLSLGGEYMTAGTLLMEKYKTRRSFISGSLAASGSIGSLVAFGFSWFYLNDHLPEEAWRYAFAFGALATYISFIFREKLKKEMGVSVATKAMQYDVPRSGAISVAIFAGVLTNVIIWIPIVYTNFYFTKILHYPASAGLLATFTALICSIVLTPLAGYLSDRFLKPEKMMMLGAVLSIPLSIVGVLCIQQGSLWGVFILMVANVTFGAPVHAVLNPLFPSECRGRYVSTCFMLGASFGSLVPVISGYLAEHYHMYNAPIVFMVVAGVVTSGVFYWAFNHN